MHYSFLKPSPNAAARAHLGGKGCSVGRNERSGKTAASAGVPLLRLAAQTAMLDTGWRPQYTFDEALQDYLKWLSEHPY